jgi:hypothetical protein
LAFDIWSSPQVESRVMDMDGADAEASRWSILELKMGQPFFFLMILSGVSESSCPMALDFCASGYPLNNSVNKDETQGRRSRRT